MKVSATDELHLVLWATEQLFLDHPVLYLHLLQVLVWMQPEQGSNFIQLLFAKCPSGDFLIPWNHFDSMGPIMIRGGASIVDGQEPGEV